MPLESKAQTRWAYANKNKPTKEGAAARDFIKAGPASPHLPERVSKPEGLRAKLARQKDKRK